LDNGPHTPTDMIATPIHDEILYGLFSVDNEGLLETFNEKRAIFSMTNRYEVFPEINQILCTPMCIPDSTQRIQKESLTYKRQLVSDSNKRFTAILTQA
jgi:hypothetical protein